MINLFMLWSQSLHAKVLKDWFVKYGQNYNVNTSLGPLQQTCQV